jgi:hypothetical protein
MAKGKSSKSSGVQSAGINSNVSRSIVKSQRRDYMESSDRIMNQLLAHKRGKRVMLTIPNPNKNETNKKFIRVSSLTVWRDPKQANYGV